MDHQSLCFHEASHAVAALHLGASVFSVSVIKKPGSDGRTMVGYQKGKDNLRTIQEAIINIAGPAADGMFMSRGDIPRVRAALVNAIESQDHADFAEHRASIKRLYSKQQQAGAQSLEVLSGQAIDQALKIVKLRWRTIREIAIELHRYGKLSGEDVKRLYCKGVWANALVPSLSPKVL